MAVGVEAVYRIRDVQEIEKLPQFKQKELRKVIHVIPHDTLIMVASIFLFIFC